MKGVFDLRVKGKGCTGDPVFRLNEVLRSRRRRITLLADPSTLPLPVITLLAGKKGYVVDSYELREGTLKVILVRA